MPAVRADILLAIQFAKERLRRCRPVLVGIDGARGAGKSTLAHSIKEVLEGVIIIPTDEFRHSPREGLSPHRISAAARPSSLDWERLRDEVLVPLRRGESVRYHVCEHRRQPGSWKLVVFSSVVLVEGTSSLHPELAPFFDVRIVVKAPQQLKEAALRRAGRDSPVSLRHSSPTDDICTARIQPGQNAIVVDRAAYAS